MHPITDGTVKSRDLGCWVNYVEKQLAYEDTEFWSERHERNRRPNLNQDVQTYQQARSRPGRAHPRGASRRPARRGA